MEGRISISRVSDSIELKQLVRISVTDHSSLVEFLRISMSLGEFASALMGVGYTRADLEVRGIELVGSTRETCEIPVFVPSGPLKSRRERTKVAVEAKENEGWKGRVSDAENRHRRIDEGNEKNGVEGMWYRVSYIRYVDSDGNPID